MSEWDQGEWWIPPEKHYQPETKKWYCTRCRRITPIKRNPEWDGSFRGKRPAPEWFVKCAKCGNKHYQRTGFECPNCGWDETDETSCIEYSKERSSYWAAMEFGGNPVQWEETHRCKKCKTVFTFTNSNY